MKIALYKLMYGDGAHSIVVIREFEFQERARDKEIIRISEPVEVDFPSLSDEAVIAAQLSSINEKEKEVRARFQQVLNALNEERAKLLSLTHQAA